MPRLTLRRDDPKGGRVIRLASSVVPVALAVAQVSGTQPLGNWQAAAEAHLFVVAAEAVAVAVAAVAVDAAKAEGVEVDWVVGSQERAVLWDVWESRDGGEKGADEDRAGYGRA